MVAVFERLAQEYREAIKNGELKPGYRFPIQPDLADQHGVAISTVHRFMVLLKREGLIYATHDGTFVGPRPEDSRLQVPEFERVTCGNGPRCNNFIELKRSVKLADVLHRTGWIYRGSTQGRVYFCHQCAPKILAREKES